MRGALAVLALCVTTPATGQIISLANRLTPSASYVDLYEEAADGPEYVRFYQDGKTDIPKRWTQEQVGRLIYKRVSELLKSQTVIGPEQPGNRLQVQLQGAQIKGDVPAPPERATAVAIDLQSLITELERRIERLEKWVAATAKAVADGAFRTEKTK